MSDSSPRTGQGRGASKALITSHPSPHHGTGSGARLWLVRHAQVDERWQGKAYGDLDVPLSAAGSKRTQELARDLAALSPTQLLTSPLQRARVLAAQVEQLSGLKAMESAALKEIDRGNWQGKTVEQLHTEEAEAVAAFYADPWNWRGHGGESDADVCARAWTPIDAALRQSDATIVVTSHYNVLRILVASALDTPPPRSFSLRVDTGHCLLLVDGVTGWELHRSNVLRPFSESPS